MVGTSATAAFRARRLSSVRRKMGTVRTIIGFAGISSYDLFGSWEGARREEQGRQYQGHLAGANRTGGWSGPPKFLAAIVGFVTDRAGEVKNS